MAVAVVFLANGASYSSWVPRIPEIRDDLGMNDAQLGLVLLGGGIGGVIGSAAVAPLIDRLGSRAVTIRSGLVLCALLPCLALAGTPAGLGVVLVAVGLADTFADIAMNAQAVAVQHRTERSIMNRIHGAWSAGAVLGALTGSLAAGLGIDPLLHLSIAGAVVAVIVLSQRSRLAPTDEPHDRAHEARRWSGIAVLLALAGAGAIGIESLALDWSAVHLVDDLGSPAGQAGLAAVVFGAAMLVGRFGGDSVVDRVGSAPASAGATIMAAVGVCIAALVPQFWLVMVGYAIWGLGVSILFPLVYHLAGRVPGLSTGGGLGMMSLGARTGLLVVPVAMGFLAERQGIPIALTVIGLACACAVGVATAAVRIRMAG